MDEIEMNEIRTESETREESEINAANRSIDNRRYETSLKTVIKNQLLRFRDSIFWNSVTLLKIFSLILSISEGLYIEFTIDDSLNSKFVRLVGIGLIFFMQCAFRCPGYKDFYLLVAKTYLSIIANILDIIQGVSNDLMKNEMGCIAFSFVQCVAISVNVGTLDYRKIDETKYNLRRGEVFCNYPDEMRVPRERLIKIDKTKIEGNNFTGSQKFPNVPQNEKNRRGISHQFPSAFQNEESQAIGGEISQFPSAFQHEENQAIGGAISQQFPSASQNDKNQAIGGTISQQFPSVFQNEENLAISLPHKNVSQNNGDSDRDKIPITTVRTTAHVHAVKERSPTRIQEASGINLSLQEAKNSPSRSSLDSNQVTLGPYTCSTHNLPKPEKLENKKFTGTEMSRSIKTIVSPNTEAGSKSVTGKFSVSKVKDDIPISNNEPNNTSQLKCTTLTSLEADSQPSSLDSNEATLEPLIDSTNNLSRSGVRDAQPSTSFDSENDTKEHLTVSPSNQPRKSKNAKKKLSYRVPLEAHMPILCDDDPSIAKIILDLRAKPSEISSVKAIKIFKCSRRRTVHNVSSFETKEKIVYNV